MMREAEAIKSRENDLRREKDLFAKEMRLNQERFAEREEALKKREALAEERKRYRFRLPDPTSRKDLEYYRDSAHRGYLSHLVAEGHGPSLFFRTPGTGSKDGKRGTLRAKKSSGAESNRLW